MTNCACNTSTTISYRLFHEHDIFLHWYDTFFCLLNSYEKILGTPGWQSPEVKKIKKERKKEGIIEKKGSSWAELEHTKEFLILFFQAYRDLSLGWSIVNMKILISSSHMLTVTVRVNVTLLSYKDT